MLAVTFSPQAFKEYNDWATDDKKVFKRFITIIADCQRDPFKGIGKPEALKHELKGYWSRRITDEHRLVYQVSTESLYIFSCKHHY
ncbi:MAG: addiction module toxin, Txe/YoeB family [Bacteroidetes bacterium]|nr:addiction module toxin, Txe/YoeB family [Bacteroidota bacterium]